MSCSCQQGILYDAESRVPMKGRMIPKDELQGYVDSLRDLPWWERNFPQVLRIETHVRHSSKDGSVGGWFEKDGCGVIDMAPCHLVEMYVLHEVTHVLAGARYGSKSHDPWFARTYLELVSAVLPSVYPSLYEEFTRGGIDFVGDFSNPGGIPLGS